MLWLGPALVLYVAVASTVLCRRRLKRIARIRILDVATVVRAIRSGERSELERLHSSAVPDTFLELVLAAVLSNDADAVRVATVNEHLGDLEREIESQRDVPMVIGRASLLSGTLASVVELSLTLGGESGPAWHPAAASFLIGLAGWMVAREIDRRGRRSASAARDEWDRVAVALGDRLTRS